MTQIVTIAQSLSNAIRAHSHPVLEAGNLSYPDGRYTVDFIPGSDRASFTLKHHIEGAPLIVRLLKQKEAQYVCTVSSPISAYRETHVSNEAAHKIQWDMEDLGEPPLFTPMILCTASRRLNLSQDQDGVHSLWNGARVSLQQGSRLALGHVIQLRSSIFHLLSFQKKEDLQEGTFFVDAETEPFRFLVNLSPELHKFLKIVGGGPDQEKHHHAHRDGLLRPAPARLYRRQRRPQPSCSRRIPRKQEPSSLEGLRELPPGEGRHGAVRPPPAP